MKKILIYTVIGLIVALSLAAELMSFYKSKFGGLNNKVNIRLLQDDESPDMSNFSLDEIGSIKERDLFGQYNTSSGSLGSNSITGLFKFYTTNSKFFLACAGTNIGLGAGGVFTDISPSNNTVTANSFYTGNTFNNRFYLFNSTSEPLVYTGTGSFHKLENSSSIPGTNCAFSAIHKARFWAARSNTLPYRVYYSSLNNAEDWVTTGGFVDLPDLTQTITGLISWGGYLYIFTETNIYVMLGSTPNDFSLRKTNSMVGAIAPRSIKVTDAGICFLSRSGVYAFDGNNSNRISDKIGATIAGMSKILIQNACALYDGQKYWLSFTPSGASYNTWIVIYDFLVKDWYLYQGDACNINYFERAYGGTDKGEIYGGSSSPNGIVYQMQSATGTESITHDTISDFNNGVSFNTVAVEDTDRLRTYSTFYSRFDAVNGDTAYTAETGQVITFVGSASISNTQAKYGSTSLSASGAANYVTIPDNNNWNFSDDKFTIDLWVRFNDVTNRRVLLQQTVDANNEILFYTEGTGIQFLAFQSVSGGSTLLSTRAPWTPSANTWYHVALTRDGSTWHMFVDGTELTLALQVGSYSAILPELSAPLKIGGDFSGDYPFEGFMDEVRVSKGIARWTSAFTTDTSSLYDVKFGTLTSQNLQINSAGNTSIGAISWIENSPTGSKISFQTRTGVTDDSVYFNGWVPWSSANTVTFNTVTDGTVMFTSSDNTNFQITKPASAQARDILYYERDDSVSPDCVAFVTTGALSTNKYAEEDVSKVNLSSVNWLTGWIKSPNSGNSVMLSMGENSSMENEVTINTVSLNTWEPWFWYIGGITSTNRDAVGKFRITYRGDKSGTVYLGNTTAQEYYSSGDNISSSPNDFIQYRMIMGNGSIYDTPALDTVTLVYTPALTTSENSLSSYYYTKWFDMQTPQINKQFESIVLELNSTTANTVTGSSALCTVYCDYDIDFGIKSGTVSFSPTTTANTVRLLKNFPSSTYGKSMRLKIYNDNKDAQVTIKGLELRYRPEQVQPD